MVIDLSSIDTTQFDVTPHLLCGETVYLVNPQRMGVNWSKENSVFRSSVWNSSGELISAGFKKFVNWGEKPEVFPTPASLKNTVVVEKLDGSLLIVSKYKGQFILRTRGTVDAYKLVNGYELDTFKAKYPKVFEFQPIGETWAFSLLFEWTSPVNRIVIDYGAEPEWRLVGFIQHEDYSLGIQEWCDTLAKQFGCPRPEMFTFGSTEELIASVEQWKGKEGVCIYSKGGQEIHKVKGQEYLRCHHFKSNATFENTVDLFFGFDQPSYQLFQSKLVEVFDWECANMVLGFTSTICDGFKEVNKIVAAMKSFVEPLKFLSRKEAAQKIISSYSTTNRSAYCFQLLDGKELDKDALKKLLYQVTKK
jgi:hypothetical protein